MPTGDARVNLALKRFLSQNRMNANFMEYLDGIIIDGLSRIFPASGLFTYPVTFNFPGVPNGTFSLSPDPLEGIDNDGRVLILEGSDLVDISYEEAVSSDYWVAMKYIQIPSGVYSNPRSGVPEYDKWEDETGELSVPDVVVDAGGGQITLTVDTILEGTTPANVDHTGRSVRVWLVNPLSADPVVAFEDVSVVYAAGNNTITTGGSFGQGAISILQADYQVAALGVTVRKSAVDPFTVEYIGFGQINVDGGSPPTPTWANGDQIDLSGGGGHTLQRAYDGPGSGGGRNVQVNYQAMRLFNQATTTREDDIINAALRIRKDNTTSLYGSGFEWDKGMEVVSRMGSGSAYLARVAIADLSGNDYLRIEEDVDLPGGSGVITFTRGGLLDLTFPVGSSGNLWQWIDVVEITGSSLGNNGVYIISAILAGSLTGVEINGTVVLFAAESGLKARIFRPLFRAAASPRGIVINAVNDFVDDDTGSGMPGPVFAINLPENTANADLAFQIIRAVDGKKLEYDAEGNLFASAKITSGGPVYAGDGLRVLANNITVVLGHIDITVGDLTLSQGTIKVTLGNIDVLAGNVNASAGMVSCDSCEVGATGLDVAGAGGIDVTGGGDIDVFNAGGINVSGGGDVVVSGAGNKVEANQLVATGFCSTPAPGASAGFRYAAETDIWKVIPLINGYQVNSGVTYWSWGGKNWISSAVIGVSEVICFPIELPDAAVIKEIAYIINTINHGTYPMAMEFLSVDHKWGAAADSTTTTHETDTSTANGFQEESTTVSPTVTVDNTDKSYYIRISSQNVNDEITAIRVRFGITELVMG